MRLQITQEFVTILSRAQVGVTCFLSSRDRWRSSHRQRRENTALISEAEQYTRDVTWTVVIGIYSEKALNRGRHDGPCSTAVTSQDTAG